MSSAAANPLALGVGAAASFAGGILGAIGSGPSKQMEALNSQIGDFSKNMTSLATQEGLGASTVFNNLMAPLQRIVQGGPQQAGWSNAQVSAYNADATNRAAATARDMGALGTGASGNPGASNARQLAAQQAAEDARSNAIAAGEVKSADVGRENFNTAVGDETRLPGVFKTANQGGEVAGKVNEAAQTSQQNIDTEKKGASFTGVLSKGLSSAGGAILGGLSPAKQAAQQTVPIPPSSGNPSGTTGVNSGGGGGGVKWSAGDNDDNEDNEDTTPTPQNPIPYNPDQMPASGGV
jgi:hypothetical protein